jgi:WD40 repeat protein
VKKTLFVALSLLMANSMAQANLENTVWTYCNFKLNDIYQTCFTKDGRYLLATEKFGMNSTIDYDSTHVRVYNVADGSFHKTLELMFGSTEYNVIPRSLNISKSGRYIIYGTNFGVTIVDTTNDFYSIRHIQFNNYYYTWGGTDFSPDETKFAFGYMDSLIIYNLSNLEIFHVYRTIGDVLNIAFSPDSNYLVYSMSDEKIRFLNLDTYNEDFYYSGEPRRFELCAVNDMFAYYSYDNNSVNVINYKTKEVLLQTTSGKGFNDMKFSSDGRYLAVANSYGIDVWDIKSKEISYTFVPSKTMNTLAISSDNEYLSASYGSQLMLFYFSSVVDIEEEGIMKPVRIIPNPAESKINLEFELNETGEIGFELLNEQGTIIKKI